MTYQGSKEKYRGTIVPLLKRLRQPGQLYWEPFLGSASILCKMDNPRLGTDNMTSLIMLWNELLDNVFVEPSTVSKELYTELMNDPIPSALQAYAGFFWSFGCLYNKGYSPAAFTKSHAFHKMRLRCGELRGAIIRAADYQTIGVRNTLIYADPPYKGTLDYRGVDSFDHEEFYKWCHRMRQAGNTVVVSEYDMPSDQFETIIEIPTKTNMRTTRRSEDRLECLFVPRATYEYREKKSTAAWVHNLLVTNP